ncbi:myeloid leukemia factor 1 isoform X2 [Sphaeramia orbicularis]|uniref:Myeloid leukemia factor 1-like n=1 Tax=Sphaeramia orbicularis TaxID=375764 RepID=A0A672Y5Z4_9TELE|nr:myeloid leukemia factor 1-like isoform X2 [Sphaeramia orbicularis]
MFNSLRRDFDDDPFFSDPFSAHREHMRQMMRSFSEPFGVPFMPSLMDGSMTRHPSSSQALRDDHRDLMRNPFGMFDGMMANMRNRMDEMHRSFESMPSDSNTHSFSSSSITTYSKVGNEPPKVFQASSSTRRAPGGIKETRRALKDSESGVEKMSIGHHIQDRGHVVEKKFNNKTGEREFNQDFQNMDESEAQTFDQEWQQKVSTFKPSGSMSRLQEPKPRNVHQAALTGPEQTHREQRKPKAEGKTHVRIASSSKP